MYDWVIIFEFYLNELLKYLIEFFEMNIEDFL